MQKLWFIFLLLGVFFSEKAFSRTTLSCEQITPGGELLNVEAILEGPSMATVKVKIRSPGEKRNIQTFHFVAFLDYRLNAPEGNDVFFKHREHSLSFTTKEDFFSSGVKRGRAIFFNGKTGQDYQPYCEYVVSE